MDIKVYKEFLSDLTFAYAVLIKREELPDYEFLDANEAFSEILMQQNIIGKNISEIINTAESTTAHLNTQLIEAIKGSNNILKLKWKETNYDVKITSLIIDSQKYKYILVNKTEDDFEVLREQINQISNYESFFDATDEMFFVSDITGKMLFFNKAVSEKLGYSDLELKKMHMLELHPKEKRQEAEEIFRDMFQGKRSVCPLPLFKKNGEYLPVETRIWFGSWDGQERIFGLSKDLSNEQEALQKFIKLFNRNPACMAITSLTEQKYINVNSAFLNVFGFLEHDVIGKTAKDLGIILETEKFDITYKQLLKNGFFNDKIMRTRSKSGKIITGLFSGEIIESQGKKFLMTAMVDLTKQKIIEDNLLKKNDMQNLLMELSSKYINCSLESVNIEIQLSLETVGKFIGADRVYIFSYDFHNRTTSNTFEWCNESIEPQIDYLQDIPLDSVSDWVSEHIEGNTIKIPDVSVLSENGSSIKEILEAQNIKSLITIPMMIEQECSGFVGFDSVLRKHSYSDSEIELLKFYAQILVNIHQRIIKENALKASQLSAEKSNETKNHFIAKVSHEIRNPLNGAWGYFNLLNEELRIKKEKDFLHKGLTSLSQVIKIADDLLDISKIEANQIEFSNEIMSIDTLLKEAVEPYKNEANVVSIKIEINIDKNITFNLIGDADRIKQVIGNLVKNAVLHSRGEKIEVGCELSKVESDIAELIFHVKDNGMGIANSEVEKIFQPFYKTENSSSGAGLGLSICKELIERMGGRMWLTSAKRKGTIFYFSLAFPVELEIPPKENHKEQQKNYNSLKGLRVLFAEDDIINQELVKEILSRRDLVITVVSNGKELLSELKVENYDLVLMDIQMPIMNGTIAAKRIREAKNNIPIVALTASIMPSEKKRYLDCGINGIVQKPIFADNLINQIYLCLQNKNRL